MVYYSFTTLTTVGFGDFHPKSNLERVFITFNFLFGIASFSFIFGIYQETLDKFKAVDEGLDEGEALGTWFNILNKFNYGYPNVKLQKRLEEFFQYKWEKDKNMVFNDERFDSVVS